MRELQSSCSIRFFDKLIDAKRVFDPDNILNPGKIVDPEPIRKDWRTGPLTPEPILNTAFDWSADRGLVAATEKCNGAGACRKSAGRGTMCPSYHVTKEEMHSTRGRANLFRQMLSVHDPREAFSDADLKEALSLCLGCKACKAECPASVDMARLKAEFLHQGHRKSGVPRADQTFGQFAVNAKRARFAPLVAGRLANTKLAKKAMGIDERRSVPLFAARTFTDWLRKRTPVTSTAPNGRVVLFVDEFTEYLEPQIAIAAMTVLEKAGWFVTPDDDQSRAREKPDGGLGVLLAQFTVGIDEGVFGTMNLLLRDGQQLEGLAYASPAPGALALLGLAGLAGTRRRRR